MSASWCRVLTIYKKYGFRVLKHRHKTNFQKVLIRNDLHKTYVCQLYDCHYLPSLIECAKSYCSRSNQPVADVEYSHEEKKTKTGSTSIAYDGKTAPGEKKDITIPLPKIYSPKFVEAAWYDWWVKQGFFSPENQTYSGTAEKFVVCLPPPNVTGTLHLGHALTNSIQDALVRWNRMKGRETLWIPGIDHAGIATQVVVEKKLMREQQKTRHQIGRDKFVDEVWKWKNEKGDTINNQMKRLGSSLDWDRTCFTMDEKLSEAVTEAFISLHDEGLIFRGRQLVNWCCLLHSTISDIEVENVPLSGLTKLRVPGYDKEVEFGFMLTFSYIVKETGETINVSTTRPETMLGDTAVAVHPDDPRYSRLHGSHVLHPFDGRELPIVFDEFVDKDFGTGAVKITPAHDHNDYEVGKRHDLQTMTVIGEDGRMVNVPDQFLGMKRFDARAAVIQCLKDKGLYKDMTSHQMVIPICSRSKDVIEPLLKEQWYLNCKEMADQAIQKVKSGDLEIIPEYYSKIWFHWLDDCMDWCLSRQLWWGHRIPAYHVKVKGQDDEIWISARSDTEAEKKASQRLGLPVDQLQIQQDSDVLDTWFSSGLFPFSPLGWPHDTADFKKYYPTSVLETGHDILFFWVARMVMLGLKLTGQLPFKQVLLHGTLRDAHGRKMSKSLGNVIDPMDVIQGATLQDLHKKVETGNLDPREVQIALEGQRKDFPDGILECGADALRFTLCCFDFKSQEVKMDIGLTENNRNFCNKIWQGYKFVQMNVGENFKPVADFKDVAVTNLVDKWILSRLSHMIKSTNQHFELYNLHLATAALYNFWIGDFCDVYLEYVKSALLEDSRQEVVRQTLHHCVEVYLTALSPFMPFLTEELYQRLPRGDNQCSAESVCISPYPEDIDNDHSDARIEEIIKTVRNISSAALQISKQYQVKKGQLSVVLKIDDEDVRAALQHSDISSAMMTLSKIKSYDIVTEITDNKKIVKKLVQPHVELSASLEGFIDIEVEINKLLKKRKRLENSLEKIVKQMKRIKSHPNRTALQQKIENVEESIKQLDESIESIKSMD